MPPKTNLIKVQLQYASQEFERFINLIVDYKWWILAGVILFIGLIYWLWRK
ncbi:MAG: hypothetical protein Q7S83_03780 [bacterium]|nr:hypothetical protein [bacterium]